MQWIFSWDPPLRTKTSSSKDAWLLSAAFFTVAETWKQVDNSRWVDTSGCDDISWLFCGTIYSIIELYSGEEEIFFIILLLLLGSWTGLYNVLITFFRYLSFQHWTHQSASLHQCPKDNGPSNNHSSIVKIFSLVVNKPYYCNKNNREKNLKNIKYPQSP